jgi:uncharacterized protein YeaO (DUF488 family)
MAAHIVRLGSPRGTHEGLRLGTVRFPPRGVAKTDWAKRDFFDVWLPLLAPQAATIKLARDGTEAEWRRFVRSYRREMKEPASRQALQLLAALSHHTDFAVGCYCADESRCHRSLLRELLREAGALLA